MRITRKVIALLSLLSVPCISQAAIYADTNGDGVTDTIFSGADSYGTFIQIDHPNTYSSSKYYIGSASTGLVSMSLIGTTDSNGLAGQEVIVLAGFTGKAYQIVIIDDARGEKRATTIGSNFSHISVKGVSNNTNGLVGNEVIVYTEYGSPLAVAVHIVDDRKGVLRSYPVSGSGWTRVTVPGIADTNGLAGAEVIMQLEKIVSGQIPVVAVGIIDDAKAVTRYYNQSTTLKTFNIQKIINYDGVVGAEVCYAWTDSYSTYYEMIVDRTGAVVSRTGC